MLLLVVLQALMLLVSTKANADHDLDHPAIDDQLAGVRLPLVYKDKLASLSSSHNGHRLSYFGMDVHGSGAYYVTLGVGSPPINQTLIMDTGSDLLWIQCQGCDPCIPNEPNPMYDPTKSSSCHWIPCDSDPCNNLNENKFDCIEKQCIYKYSYADNSYTKGSLAWETLTINGTTIQNVTIGSGIQNHDFSASDFNGILGLGRGSLSLVSQSSGVIGEAFSFCMGYDGWLTFRRSGFPGEKAKWASLNHTLKYPSFYYIDLLRLEVEGKPIDIPGDTFQIDLNTGDGGVIIDTGTTVTQLSVVAYNALRDNVMVHLDKLFSRFDSNYPVFDTCYSLGLGVVLEDVSVPNISFIFQDMYNSTKIIQIKASNVLTMMDSVKNVACFAFAPSDQDIGISIIGNMQLEGIQISVDASAGFVGFGPTGVC